VTATCTTAAAARYGDLTVDSNLPDVRICIGGPDQNGFTAAVLDGVTVVDGAECTWIPAARPLRDVWVPGADLRDVRALPVLVIHGAGSLEAAVAAVVGGLAEAEIVVDQPAPTDLDDFSSRTVAVFNRGVPSFAVDSDGTLHTSLMRSCTGWPSGTWIDFPRRTAPDGSNFQSQHWTHRFDYAVACGRGDWRDADIPTRSREFAQPLLAVAADHDSTAGGLPSWGSLLGVEPAREVALAALKPIGNPLAAGSARSVDPADGIVIRLVETRGRSTAVTVGSGLRKLSTPQRLDLLEQPLADQTDGWAMHGYEIATFGVQLNHPWVVDADGATLAPDAEPAQPLYARYWLHNRGPAPLGGLPVVAHLHPHQLAVDPNSTVQVQLTAASDVTDVPLHGKVRLVAAPGWTVAVDELPFVLPPGEFVESIVDLTMPPDTAPGLYPLRAELGASGSGLPASWRQVVEDVCVIAVGATDDRVLRLVTDPEPVTVAAGATARIAVTVGTDARADLAVEAHLISPWGTWEWMGPNIIGATVAARGSVELEFVVAPPGWVEPGEWWALIRVACAGELVYSPAVTVVVR
jgi:alpha-mannosidase